MLQRVMPELMGMKQILALNDEAHHCYRQKPPDPDDEALKGDERKEAEKNNEAARLWVSGLEAVNRTLGLQRVLNLSATPFFLRGSGYAEGTLFPWTMGNRGRECGRPSESGMARLQAAHRVEARGTSLSYVRFLDDFPAVDVNNIWSDVKFSSRSEDKLYVVQTAARVVQRCISMSTDPAIHPDPACGSGTPAFVAEQWGRRWITIDTSRVALALARARIMGARYPYYLLADSVEGLRKEAEVSGRAFTVRPTHGNVRQGFVYERVPHITLKSIANNAEIDVIYDEHQPRVQAALDRLNVALRGHETPFRVTDRRARGKDVRFDAAAERTFTLPSGEVVAASALLEWEAPREAPADWPEAAKKSLGDFSEARIARQIAIDASIAGKAEFEFLFDRPTSIRRPSALPARSPSKASARTALSAWTRTTS